MSNKNNDNSKLKLLIGAAVLVGIIAIAAFIYPRISQTPTETQQQAINDMAKNKENIDKKKQEPAENDSGKEATDTENSGEAESEEATEPILAPDFTVYTQHSEPVKFSEKVGKPIILNFWATWCGPCQREHPYFQTAYEQYGDVIEFMMINPTDGYNDTNESVDKFIEEHGYTFPVYRDLMSEAHSVYGINSFPTTVLIDEDGYFIGGYAGALTQEMLDMLIGILIE